MGRTIFALVSDDTMTVHELSRRVSLALQGAFPDEVWVAGEISGLTRSARGHVYFDLVEPIDEPGASARATFPVVLFDQNRRGVNAQLRRGGTIRMTDGVGIRIRGFVDFYPPQGRVQLRMTGIDPEYTLGRLAAEREALVRRLREQGLLDRNRGVPLPRSPLRVGLVTSGASAAAADFLHELEVSRLAWEIVAVDVRVQGRTAEGEIVAALSAVATAGVDVIAVVRGGGARTDLATFDSEAIARTIAECAVPVVTGIGHEIDDSVADLVAHRRYKTPTACARGLVELVVDEHRGLEDRWAGVLGALHDHLGAEADDGRDRAARVVTATRRRLRGEHHRTLAVGLGLGRLADGALRQAAGRLERTVGRLAPAARSRVRLGEQGIESRAREVRHLDPQRTLERGFSLTRVDGRAVRSVEEVAAGDRLTTVLTDGEVESVVGDETVDDGRD